MMKSRNPSFTSPRHQAKINFYSPSCWVSKTICRVADTAYTHCTVEAGDTGLLFHVDEDSSRWRSCRSLHKLMDPLVQLRLFTPRPLNVGHATPILSVLRFDATALSAWAINRRKGHVTDQPDSCVEAVRRWLAIGGLEIEQGTPDEIYYHLIQDYGAVPLHHRRTR